MRVQLDRGIWVSFFDKSGDEAYLVNAKYFVISIPKIKRSAKFSFSKVRIPSEDKEAEVLLQYLYLYDKFLTNKTRKEEKYPEPEFKGKAKGKITKGEDVKFFAEQMAKEEELASLMYEDLLDILEIEDKKLSKKLEQEEISRLMEEEISREFIEEILEQDIPHKISLHESKLFSVRLGREGNMEKIYFTYKEPIRVDSPNSKFMYEFFKQYLKPHVKAISENILRDGEKLLLFRMTYEKLVDGMWHPDGIPVDRWQTDFKSFADIVTKIGFPESISDKKFERYLQSYDIPSIYITGFTLENIYEFT